LKFSDALIDRYLIDKATYLQAMRRYDELTRMGRRLKEMDRFSSTGDFFLGLGIMRGGRENVEIGKGLLENAAASARPVFRARSILALGGLAAQRRDSDEPYYYIESLVLAREAGDAFSIALTQKQLAINKEKDGRPRACLADLDHMFPLIEQAGRVFPYIRYDFLNSYAVALGNCGQIETAASVQQRVMGCSFISAHPEWIETASEIEERLLSRNRVFYHNINFHIPDEVGSLRHKRDEMIAYDSQSEPETDGQAEAEPDEREEMLRLYAEAMEILRQMDMRERVLGVSALRDIAAKVAKSSN